MYKKRNVKWKKENSNVSWFSFNDFTFQTWYCWIVDNIWLLGQDILF